MSQFSLELRKLHFKHSIHMEKEWLYRGKNLGSLPLLYHLSPFFFPVLNVNIMSIIHIWYTDK